MTHDKDFWGDLMAPTERPVVVAVPLGSFDALPLSVRVADRLAEILVIASELRAELEMREAALLKWIAPDVDTVLEETGALLDRLAS
jgi:hypothetical protein